MTKYISRKSVWIGLGMFSLWLLGALWADTWIEKKNYFDFPSRPELNAAYFFWSTTPTASEMLDSEKALKFSWLRASTEINKKEDKSISQIVNILTTEFQFTAKHIERNGKSFPLDMEVRAVTQLLTFLNRLNLFQDSPHSALDEKLLKFGESITNTSPSTQENWHREMMIRAHLKKDQLEFKVHRERLIKTLSRNAHDIPIKFINGVVNFYDGVLLCITRNSQEALPFLDLAANNFASNPRHTTNFLNGDLNVLLLGKGMESSPSCNKSISTVILAGV